MTLRARGPAVHFTLLDWKIEKVTEYGPGSDGPWPMGFGPHTCCLTSRHHRGPHAVESNEWRKIVLQRQPVKARAHGTAVDYCSSWFGVTGLWRHGISSRVWWGWGDGGWPRPVHAWKMHGCVCLQFKMWQHSSRLVASSRWSSGTSAHGQPYEIHGEVKAPTHRGLYIDHTIHGDTVHCCSRLVEGSKAR